MSLYRKKIVELLQEQFPTEEIVGAEVGVWKGKTAFAILDAMPNVRLHLIDPWSAVPQDNPSWHKCVLTNEWDRTYHEVLAKIAGRKYSFRCIVHREESARASVKFASGALAFVFIDGDHSHEGVLADSHHWWPAVRSGGLVLWHDYGTKDPALAGVTTAVNQFLEDREIDRRHLGKFGSLVWLTKP